jgi:hypothetical protein
MGEILRVFWTAVGVALLAWLNSTFFERAGHPVKATNAWILRH